MENTSTERVVLKISGSERQSFLQGLVTNDVNGLKDGLVYSALLTPQGKYLADFFLVPTDDAILLDVSADLAQGLAQRLSMYKLRADVAVKQTALIVSRGLTDAPEGSFSDPRNVAMGWRAYGSEDRSQDVDWNALRVAHLIPETGEELHGDSYILECGFEQLNGVDFKKGCYVGQEIIARMKHKTELRKGLARVEIDGDAAAGTELTSNGKAAGMLHTVSGDKGIAYLRFDRAQGDMAAGDAIVRMVG
ncbi:MAG: folate-binding protein [Paracoccaceae bacterium]|nr:folate-binding protein [Paracoccaceae bacterium]MDG2258994.1 folate-binding protein [Paracoccaceae bacterium]